ncbi:MAG: A/G-specific adenine glycosylase, partial [Acidimicrobiaceae bacterium]
FEGSFRQGRGQLLDRLRAGPVQAGDVAVAAGWPDEPDRAHIALAALVSDGMVIVSRDGTAHLR